MERCLISLGGNVGDVASCFAWALSRLDATEEIRVERVSSRYVTEPIGERAGPTFLNAAAELHTRLSAHELFALLQSLEAAAGRRHGPRWTPRPLDLDVISYGERVIETTELCIPHPACWYRRFVLDPVAEIAADVLHPVKGCSFGRLRERLIVRPLPIAVSGADSALRRRLCVQLEARFRHVCAFPWEEAAEASKQTAALVLWLGSPAVGEHAAHSAVNPPATRFADLPSIARVDLSVWPRSDQPNCAAEVVLSAVGTCIRQGD